MGPKCGASDFEVAMMFRVLKVSLLLVLALTPLPSVISLSNDGQLLLQFKRSVKDDYGALGSWNGSDSFPCSWAGITCDLTSQQVIGVDLFNANLVGSVPAMLCQLPQLTSLGLGFNYFGGAWPSGMGNCSRLESLDLSYNTVVGRLPADINKLQSLTILDLSYNNFSGQVPHSFGDLPALTSLNISANLLEGGLPPEIGNLSNLVELAVDSNYVMGGSLPTELGNLTRLEYLSGISCDFSGPLPSSLGNTNLTTLKLRGNSLSGPLPSTLGQLKRLQLLDLSLNIITGAIPSELMLLSELNSLYLWQNNLTGQIPIHIENLTSLLVLDLSRNQLNGTIPEGVAQLLSLEVLHAYGNRLTGTIPSGIGALRHLSDLHLFDNLLTGQIPPSLGQFSVLVFLDLSTNALSGPLPPNLCAGQNLTELILFQNSLSGSIPDGLGACPSLTRVRLEANHLSSSVPPGLWGSPNLQSLYLADNLLNGSIGKEIEGAAAMQALHVFNNQLTGVIPSEIGKVPNLTDVLASGNVLGGNLPIEIFELQWLSTLDLGSNAFDGSIPAVVGRCLRLTNLNLSSNRLSGEIPPQLGSLPALNTLDFSYNELSGPVPPELGKLALTQYNFSYNNLSGVLPAPFNVSSLPSSFVGNPALDICVQNETSCGQQQDAIPTTKSGGRGSVAWALGATFAAAAVILLVGGCCMWRRYNGQFCYWKNGGRKDELTWNLRSFQKMSFMQDEVFDTLQEKCLIGSGGSGKVYKAELSNGQFVAVKKLEARNNKGFEAEVDTLGQIRHRNIVKLLCCCWNDEANLLVYEYMPNGSLGDYLHSAKNSLVLYWDLRLKIALGAAEGLAYLHHDCTPPIVHRDVKSNNILLDDDFEAHLGDFGLAKAFECKAMSTVAGSFGYIAPEYGYTLNVTEKGDIYSFGVVLLELVTGRRPIEREFGDVDIVRWVAKKIETKAGAVEALDPEIRDEAQESMMVVLKVGLLCTNSVPGNRPSMRNVVQILLEACRIRAASQDQSASTEKADEEKAELVLSTSGI